jgi:hypothetical protein
MKKAYVTLAALWLGFHGLEAGAQPVDNTKLIRSSGEVRGAVQCGSGDPAAGATVYIPGESFLARTDEIGEFTLRYVPAGTYELVIEIAGQVSGPIPVQVTEKKVTNLGVLSVNCPQVCTPSPEICDGQDNDCNNQIDEGLGDTTCGVGACTRTVQNCVGGEPQTCTPGTPGTETCNGVDDDCDGVVDDGFPSTPCDGADGDLCLEGMTVCDASGTTCTDTTGTNAEICNSFDDDCDGEVDEGGVCP